MTLQERYDAVIGWFAENRPDSTIELHYQTPFQLLVAVLLSAQCTDKRINAVTPALFQRFPDAQTMAQASPQEILQLIASVSYPNAKAEHLFNMAQQIVTRFNGELPQDRDALTTLPGVGRKTANVICATLWQMPTLAVDTHVFRVANRIGLTQNSKNPLQTELTMLKYIPQKQVQHVNDWLVLHGRYICKAREPQCHQCGLTQWCLWYETNK